MGTTWHPPVRSGGPLRMVGGSGATVSYSPTPQLGTKEKPSETRNLSMGDMQKLTKKWNSRLGLQSAMGPYSMHSMWPDFVLAPPPTPWIYWSIDYFKLEDMPAPNLTWHDKRCMFYFMY